MRYDVRYTREANIDLAKLEKSEPKAFKKATRLIEELRVENSPQNRIRTSRTFKG